MLQRMQFSSIKTQLIVKSGVYTFPKDLEAN
jgi:hypothetical protein